MPRSRATAVPYCAGAGVYIHLYILARHVHATGFVRSTVHLDLQTAVRKLPVAAARGVLLAGAYTDSMVMVMVWLLSLMISFFRQLYPR